MTSWAERQRDADAAWRHERMTAEQVPCAEPGCGALEQETCRNGSRQQRRRRRDG
jgi:hypothetical protein